MALDSYARTLFGPVQQGDLSLVLIKLGAGSAQAALADGSSPDVSVATPGGGVYNITFPSGERGMVLGEPSCVASPGTAPGDKATITAFSATAGTLSLTKSDTTNLTGAEQIHLVVLLVRN